MNSKRRTTRPPSIVDVLTANPRVNSTGASIFAGASSTRVLGGEVNNSQRDQNRATIIINVGGSEADTSRATSALSKASTSGLVRDSPDVSPSSASDQERNSILEESSVSSDSGFDRSDTPFEIESPLTEEESPVEEEPSNAIYERHMYLKKHGFPLWIPQPNMRLSRSYRRQGVSIGDVGIFTSDGGFDFLFNICLPAGHPSNPNELPEGFSRLDLEPADVCEFLAHSSHSHMASPSIQKHGRATFECSYPDGAILTMPYGAYHEDLRNITRFRDYTLIHAESWYRYANGRCGREIGNAELHLVTGCDKTTSWGIATYSHLLSKRFKDSVTLLRFNTVSNELRSRHDLYPLHAWDYEGAAEAKAGPEGGELMDLPEAHGSALLRNQCTFVRSLTPALGDDDWKRLASKAAAPAEAQKSATLSPKNPFASVLGAISSLGRIGCLRGHSRAGTSRLTAQTRTAHPATYVIDMLLQKCPKAKVVVVHDSDWFSVIRDSDNDWMSTSQDLQYRIQEAFNIIEKENGTVYLREKMRSSQQPSTTSQVSVKLEDEDLPLVADRKPGFLQLFDSFEISTSDMKVDSPPRSFKKSDDDWNNDIKPNVYHDSGKDNDDSGDEDNPVLDADFLEFVLHQIQNMKNSSSFKESSSFPRLFNTLANDCNDDPGPTSSKGQFELGVDHKDSPWSSTFLEFISVQVEKIKNSSFSKHSFSPLADDCDDDNKSNKDHNSSKAPLKIETNDLENKHRAMLNTFIKVMFQRMKDNNNSFKSSSLPRPIEKSTDDKAKPDLFDDSDEADLDPLKGSVRKDAKINFRAPSDDEHYPMLDAVFSQNAGLADIMLYDGFSGSSEPDASRLSSFGGFRDSCLGRLGPRRSQDFFEGPGVAESVNRRDSELFTQLYEPNPLISSFLTPISPHLTTIPAKRKQGPNNNISNLAQDNYDDNGDNSQEDIRCICGYTCDDGFSIACDDCSRWCHAACFAIVEGGVPEEWFCWECLPRPVDSERAARFQRERLEALQVAPEKKGRQDIVAIDGGRRRQRLSVAQQPQQQLVVPNEDEHIDTDEPWTRWRGFFIHPAGDRDHVMSDPASEAQTRANHVRRNKTARFACSLCSQTFTTNTNLRNHLNVHLAPRKDHRCPHCSKLFATQSTLHRHFKTCQVLQTKLLSEPVQQPIQENL